MVGFFHRFSAQNLAWGQRQIRKELVLRVAVEHLIEACQRQQVDRPPIGALMSPFLSLAPCFVRKSLVDGVAKRFVRRSRLGDYPFLHNRAVRCAAESDNHVCQRLKKRKDSNPQPNRNRMRLALMSAAPKCGWLSGLTGTPIPFAATPVSPRTCLNWPTGCDSAASVPSRWNPPACIGSRCSRAWSLAGSRSAWSTPTPPSTLPAARPMWTIANGYSICIRWDCTVRAVLRHRDSLITLAASRVQRMQKSLDQMNLHLHHVISDITGQTGLAILDAILAGEREPQKLAKLRDRRVKSRPARKPS